MKDLLSHLQKLHLLSGHVFTWFIVKKLVQSSKDDLQQALVAIIKVRVHSLSRYKDTRIRLLSEYPIWLGQSFCK